MTELIEDVAYRTVQVRDVTAFLVWDDDPQRTNPLTDQDNAGTLYSWVPEFSGDKRIYDTDFCNGLPYEAQNIALCEFFSEYYDAALVIPLCFSDYGSSGATLYESDPDDANCAIVFTQAEIDHEWSGHLDSHPVEMKNADGTPTGEVREYGGARQYAKARVEELDQWLRGNVFGIVAKDDNGDVLESVWGFIGDPDSNWITDKLRGIAEDAAAEVERERTERDAWAARGVVTR